MFYCISQGSVLLGPHISMEGHGTFYTQVNVTVRCDYVKI